MKKLILILLLAVPFVLFGQKSDVESILENTVWNISLAEVSFDAIVAFKKPGPFGYIGVSSGSPQVNRELDEHQWSVTSNGNIVIKFTNGFLMCVGKMNDSNTMSGTFVNEKGNSGTWTGERIKF